MHVILTFLCLRLFSILGIRRSRVCYTNWHITPDLCLATSWLHDLVHSLLHMIVTGQSWKTNNNVDIMTRQHCTMWIITWFWRNGQGTVHAGSNPLQQSFCPRKFYGGGLSWLRCLLNRPMVWLNTGHAWLSTVDRSHVHNGRALFANTTHFHGEVSYQVLMANHSIA
jgi:hypothetical protein